MEDTYYKIEETTQKGNYRIKGTYLPSDEFIKALKKEMQKQKLLFIKVEVKECTLCKESENNIEQTN